jgi:hypothetical protein
LRGKKTHGRPTGPWRPGAALRDDRDKKKGFGRWKDFPLAGGRGI